MFHGYIMWKILMFLYGLYIRIDGFVVLSPNPPVVLAHGQLPLVDD